MSAPSSELFPDSEGQQYNSYQDVNVGQVVDDPINLGVTQQDFAGQLSDKEMNFKALREQANKFKEEREYWKGQAEALSTRQPEPQQEKSPYESFDWDDGDDVRKAFDSLRNENQSLRYEVHDAIKALNTKAQRSDWDNMVTEHVPQLTSKNPMFAEMIQKASNPYEAAYLLAELNSKSTAAQPTQNQGYAQRAINNANKPQTLASVGGGGSLSSADYYANMSDADFFKIASKNMANI